MKKVAFIVSLLLLSGGFIPAQAAQTKCKDGTYSSSTGKGTCSSHGGVAISPVQLGAAAALLERQKYINLVDSAKMLEIYEGRYTETDLNKINNSGWKEFQVCVSPKFPEPYSFCWTVSEYNLPSKKNLKDIYKEARLADQCINKNSTKSQRNRLCVFKNVRG